MRPDFYSNACSGRAVGCLCDKGKAGEENVRCPKRRGVRSRERSSQGGQMAFEEDTGAL